MLTNRLSQAKPFAVLSPCLLGPQPISHVSSIWFHELVLRRWSIGGGDAKSARIHRAILFLHGLKSIKLRHPQRAAQINEIPSESRYCPDWLSAQAPRCSRGIVSWSEFLVIFCNKLKYHCLNNSISKVYCNRTRIGLWVKIFSFVFLVVVYFILQYFVFSHAHQNSCVTPKRVWLFCLV